MDSLELVDGELAPLVEVVVIFGFVLLVLDLMSDVRFLL